MCSMKMQIFNTRSRKKEVFKPQRKRHITLYTCGPTVYNYAHIGNLRTFIFEDILKRTLMHKGYKVTHLMNITDVDDKTIAGASKAGVTLRSFTRKYEKYFKQDLKKLNILSPTRFARATEHIAEILREIKTLKARGFAYAREGSVYFDVSKFRAYGKLSKLNKTWLQNDARVESDEYSKDEAQDFALWKAKKGNEPFWPSPFGLGRPGWHIECSTMARKYLGQPLDIHAGGVDLIFPHHENETAQAEAAHQKQFVRYWLPGEHLLVRTQKMSKSLGNIFTLHYIAAEHKTPLAFRYFTLTAHYRSPLNFTWEAMEGAETALENLCDFARNLKTSASRKKRRFISLSNFQKRFWSALYDDLNTPQGIAVIWELVHRHNKNPDNFNPKDLYKLLCEFDTALGLGFKKIKTEKIPPNIAVFLGARERARKEMDFAKADSLRAKMQALGWQIEDTASGPRLKKNRL